MLKFFQSSFKVLKILQNQYFTTKVLLSGNDRNRNRKINSKKLGIADKEHYLNKGGWGHKTAFKLYIYHPINLHGGDFRFVKLFNQGKKLWQRQT